MISDKDLIKKGSQECGQDEIMLTESFEMNTFCIPKDNKNNSSNSTATQSASRLRLDRLAELSVPTPLSVFSSDSPTKVLQAPLRATRRASGVPLHFSKAHDAIQATCAASSDPLTIEYPSSNIEINSSSESTQQAIGDGGSGGGEAREDVIRFDNLGPVIINTGNIV
jgi:hypothetical protein